MGGILLGPDGFLEQLRHRTGTDRSRIVSDLVVLAQPDYGMTGAVLLGCLELLREGKLATDELRPHMPAVLEIWSSLYTEIARQPLRPAPMDWACDEDYSGLRSDAEGALELLGHLPFEGGAEALRVGLSLHDPRLRLAAAISLLRRGDAVDDQKLELVAACDEVRILLWEQLRELGLSSLMPERWSTSEQLAVSSFLRWASHPMELGAAPDEIEALRAYVVETDKGRLKVHLLRFRAHVQPSSEEGNDFLAGIAGPFHEGREVDPPWSFFAPWDSMQPDEHFRQLYYRSRTCGVRPHIDEAPTSPGRG